MDRNDLNSILLDKDLAKLGDSYVNFIYSVALTAIYGVPSGAKVSDKILVEAANRAGMRSIIPKRTPRGRIADAVEALLIYSVIKSYMGFKEMVELLINAGDTPSEGFARIIDKILWKFNNI